jgi:hypothetical protein
MKNLILTLFATCFAMVVSAQVTAVEYMNRTPGIPDNVCKDKGSKQDVFNSSVNDLYEAIEKDASQRNRVNEEVMKSHENEMKTNMLKQSGLSDEDMKKVSSGKEMTEAEKMEMADRALKQKTNMSMEDAKNLKNMSKEEQQIWAQKYAAGQMAAAQANPAQTQAENQKNMEMYQLLSEQTDLRNKISAMENSLQQEFTLVDQEAQTARVKLDAELKPLFEALNSINDGEGSTQRDVDKADSIMKIIHAKQDKYCESFTPKLLAFIAKSKQTIKNSIPDYDRAEEIQFKVTSMQTGTTLEMKSGSYSIQAVSQYLGYLGKAYRYKLYRIDN